MITSIEVTVQAEGFHYWPQAPRHREYLGRRHRHVFVVTTGLEVNHADREVEFHDLRDRVMGVMTNRKDKDWGARSCEDIARWVLDVVDTKWPGRRRWCRVSEDGECAALVEITPE